MTPSSGADGPIRVLLVDDHEIVRRGIADLVADEPDLVVVGEAGSVAEATTLVSRVGPDVAVVDVRLPDGSGIDLCRDIRSRCPDVAVLVLTSYDDDDALTAAVLAGAHGYLLKQIRGASLVDAVRRLAAGGQLLDPELSARARRRLAGIADRERRLDALTERERQVLALVAEGLSNRQIGERLHLAEKTVKNYVSAVLAKLELTRRTQAALLQRELDP